MPRLLYLALACLAIGPEAICAKGLILGYETQNYFAMAPETGQVTDLGFGPPGRGDFLPGGNEFAITSDGLVYGLQSSSEFTYDPFQQEGEGLGYRDSNLEDFAQGPNGEVYLLSPFGGLEILNPDTRQVVHSYSGMFFDKVAATSNGEVVLASGAFLSSLDTQTGETTPLDTFLPGKGMPFPNALGADSDGNVLFTTQFPNNEIYRVDPSSGVIDAVRVDFDPQRTEFISPGPAGSVILGGYFEGVRRVDLATGATLWSVPWGQHFTPEFALYTTALPAPVPGDYDSDGYVDGNDYLLWRQSFASTTDLRADGNANGVVDAADYTIWRDNTVADSAASHVPVPEPAGWLMMAFAATCLQASRRLGARSLNRF